MKLPYTEVKSQTGLSSLRFSCKRALRPAVQKQYARKISPPEAPFLITAQILHSDMMMSFVLQNAIFLVFI